MTRKSQRSQKQFVVWAIRSVISVLRNRQFQFLLGILAILSLATILIVYLIPDIAVITVIFSTILMLGFVFIFPHWRYREIEKLSAYFIEFSIGNFLLNVSIIIEVDIRFLK